MMIHSQLEENTLEVSCNRSSSAHNGLGQSSAWYCVMVLVMGDQQLPSFAFGSLSTGVSGAGSTVDDIQA